MGKGGRVKETKGPAWAAAQPSSCEIGLQSTQSDEINCPSAPAPIKHLPYQASTGSKRHSAPGKSLGCFGRFK